MLLLTKMTWMKAQAASQAAARTTDFDGGMVSMKKHKFWAWAMVFCAFMTMYTGHKKA